ncbi:MAG TPA: SGNH/GDSL hydrolase family protein, partial [Lacipirellulaceae bacterium]|nr:SGNH/GDSL hydrolase family protein [Lacipirellulaceae bacterium]
YVGQSLGGPFSNLIVFGDSLSDVGNISYASFKTNPGPYYADGRFSNGPIYAESLATGLGLPALTRSTAGGNDYAFGGAQTTGTKGGQGLFINDVDEQVSKYLSAHNGASDALYVVFAGANDFLNGQTNVSVPLNSLAGSINRLVAGGARQFLVFNLPPLGDTPKYNGNASTESQYNLLTQQFNAGLGTMLAGMQSGNPAINVFQFDTYGLFEQVLANPAGFGLTDVTNSAAPGLTTGTAHYDTSQEAPNPDQYLFWDDVHPTTAVHAILAQRALDLFRLPGDFNGDGVVDGADYIVWREGQSPSHIPDDYNVWRSHFGQTAGNVAGAEDFADVPEPTSGVLISLFLVFVRSPSIAVRVVAARNRADVNACGAEW